VYSNSVDDLQISSRPFSTSEYRKANFAFDLASIQSNDGRIKQSLFDFPIADAVLEVLAFVSFVPIEIHRERLSAGG